MAKAWSYSAAAGTRGRSYLQIQEKQASSVDCSSNTEDPSKKSWCLMPVILLVLECIVNMECPSSYSLT